MSPVPAWMETRGQGVRVMVFDNGFNAGHKWVTPVEVRSFVPGVGTECKDQHGDLICEIIASKDPFRLGIAPNCEIYVAKVAGGNLSWAAFCSAVEWAIDLNIDVINISLAFAENNIDLGLRLAQLDAAGVICMAAYSPVLGWPHSEPSVISVGGAPGCDVVTSIQSHQCLRYDNGRPFTGSSVACATLAGVAACAKAFNPKITRSDFLAALR